MIENTCGIVMPRPALLVIDMQKDIAHHKKRKKALSILPRMKKIIQNAHEAKIPIFYTKIVLNPDDVEFKRFGEVYCVKGTAGCDIIDELKPLKGHIIEKNKHSAFFQTELDRMLKENRVDTVILTGMQTQICIMTTAADAFYREYKVIVVDDCVESTRREKKEWALEWIREYIGDTLSTEETLDLLRSCLHENTENIT